MSAAFSCTQDGQTLLAPLAFLLSSTQGNDLKLSHLNDLHRDFCDDNDDNYNVDDKFKDYDDASDADHRSESKEVCKEKDPTRPGTQVIPPRDKPRRVN